MATLSAVKFATPDGAERTAAALRELQERQLITVLDAAIVSWPAGATKPRTRQLADASGVTLEIEAARLPLLPSALEMAAAGHVPGGGETNRAFFGPRVEVRGKPSEALLRIFFDPQTSGGLLLAIPPGRAEELLGRLAGAGVAAGSIGAAVPRREPSILLT